jgi:hypothetical protein
MKRLNSAREVIEALGGRDAVMEMTGATGKAVWNWAGYFNAFPADCYKLMIDKLARKNLTAAPYLWRQRGFEKPKRAA